MDALVRPVSKLPHVGTTIFSEIAEQAQRHQAINLAQGAPDFACDPNLVELAHEAMCAGHNQYAPMTGLPALREQLAAKVQSLYDRRYCADDEITITGSASQGLYAAISALVHPGDEVIYFEPCFDSYAPIVELQGAKAVGLKLKAADFGIDWDQLSATINSNTRMIILNTPHNPTGTVLSSEDMQRLQTLLHNSPIVVLSDEVYEHVVFDNAQHQSIARFADLAARSVIVSSFGKSFHVTGWRVGYCLAPAALMAEIRKVHQFMMFSADTPMQHALANYMRTKETYLHLADFYQHKRDLLINLLQHSKLKLRPCQGSFFLLADYRAISDLPDSDFVLHLIEQHKVATIPLSAFYSDGYDNHCIRLSFAKDDQSLIAGAEALCQL